MTLLILSFKTKIYRALGEAQEEKVRVAQEMTEALSCLLSFPNKSCFGKDIFIGRPGKGIYLLKGKPRKRRIKNAPISFTVVLKEFKKPPKRIRKLKKLDEDQNADNKL